LCFNFYEIVTVTFHNSIDLGDTHKSFKWKINRVLSQILKTVIDAEIISTHGVESTFLNKQQYTTQKYSLSLG